MPDQIDCFSKVVKFETFFGTNIHGDSASDKVNKWLEKHPNARILDFKYSATSGEYLRCDAICIMYECTEVTSIDV